MNELTRQCLSLSTEERIKLANILKESLRNDNDDKSRFSTMLKIATDVVGDGIMSKSREFKCSFGRRMIAYQMRKEGFTLTKIGIYLNRHHASVVHMIQMMEDIFKFPGCFKMDEMYWNEFIKKLNEYDIYNGTTQGS